MTGWRSRLVAVAACCAFVRHGREPGDDYVVMTDPAGNPFCVCATTG